MIVKGSVREGAADLARHLQRDDNALVLVIETWGLAADEIEPALREIEARGRATSRCRKTLYHLSFNPAPEKKFFLQREAMIARRHAEKELNLCGQPGIQIAHVKGGRVHFHTVWLMVRDGKLIPYGHNYRTHERIARHLERMFGHALVIGAHDREEGVPRPARTLRHGDTQQAERTGVPVSEVAEDIARAWTLSDSGRSFKAAIESLGYLLAHGDSRDVVVIDPAGGVHSPSRRIDFLRAADVTRGLSDLDPKALPTVLEARAILRARLDDQPEEDQYRRRRKRVTAELAVEKPPELELVPVPPKEPTLGPPAIFVPSIRGPVREPEPIRRLPVKRAPPVPEMFLRPNASLETRAPKKSREASVGDYVRATMARPAGVVIDAFKGALVVKGAERVYLDGPVNTRGVTVAVKAAAEMHGATLSLDGSDAFRTKVVSTIAQNRGLRLVKLTGADGVALEKARAAEAAKQEGVRRERLAARAAERVEAERRRLLADEQRARQLQTLRQERARAEEAAKKEEDDKKKKAAALLAPAAPMPFAPPPASPAGAAYARSAVPPYLRGLPPAMTADWLTTQLPRPFTPKETHIRRRQLDRMLAAAPYIVGSERASGTAPEPNFDDGFCPNPSAGPDTGFQTWKPILRGMASPAGGMPWSRPYVSFDTKGPTIRVLDPKGPQVVQSAVRRALWRWDPATIKAVGPPAFVHGVDRLVKAAQYASRTPLAAVAPAVEVVAPVPVRAAVREIGPAPVAPSPPPDTSKENIAKVSETLSRVADVAGACRRLGGGGATPEELQGVDTALRAALSDHLALHTLLGKGPLTPSIRITPAQALVGLEAALGLSHRLPPIDALPSPSAEASVALTLFGDDPRRQAVALTAIASQDGFDPVDFVKDHGNATAESRAQGATDQAWRQAAFDITDPQRGRADRLLALGDDDKRMVGAMRRLGTTSVADASRSLGSEASSSNRLSPVSQSALSVAQWDALARSKGQDPATFIASASMAAARDFEFFLSRASEAKDQQLVAAYLKRGEKDAADAAWVAEATISQAARLDEAGPTPPRTHGPAITTPPTRATPVQEGQTVTIDKKPSRTLSR